MTSLHEIKERLLRVINKDGSVLNFPVVMELIGLLEKTSISRNELEETRIGKYINEVRRASKDVSLRRRAKKLIISWQQMISSTVQAPKKSIAKPSSTDSSFKRAQSSPSICNDIKNNKHVPSNNINGRAQQMAPSSKKNTLIEKDFVNKKNAKTKINSKAHTIIPKSKSAQSLPEVAKSSFTCKPNGLKMKFSNVSSSSSNQLHSASEVPPESQRFKRKRKEESVEAKAFTSKLSSKPDNFNSLPKRTSIKKEAVNSPSTSLKKIPLNHSATTRTNVHKSSSPPDVAWPTYTPALSKKNNERDRLVKAGEIGNSIMSSSASRQFGDELAGIDGCRTNDGAWHPWAESFVVRRTMTFVAEAEATEESEHLSILPYVELD